MKPRVICISRTLGAGGQHVARTVSQKLAYRYVDEEIIKEVAEREHVDVAVVEDAERRKSFLDRLLDSLAVSPAPELMAFSPGFPLTPAEVEASGDARTTEYYRRLIREVVLETAESGDVVIFAHAAAMALGPRPDVLRVLVTASPATRAERVAAAHGLSARDAEKAITDSDRDRRAYLEDFYGIAEELPTHYDLVVSTDVLTPRQGADVVLALAHD